MRCGGAAGQGGGALDSPATGESISTAALGLRSLSELALILRTRFAINGATVGVPSLQALRILEILAASPEPIGPSALADELYLTRSAVTQILHTLEGNQLVERVKHPGDRRLSGARLTVTGRRVLRSFLPGVRQREERIMSVLSTAEQEQLHGFLARVITHVVDRGPDYTDRPDTR